MTNLWNKLEDNLNPIFLNDIKKYAKTITFGLNLIFLFCVYYYLFYILYTTPIKTLDFEINCYKILSFYFLISFAAIPLELYKVTTEDFKKNNMYFIFFSNLSAPNYINGKILLALFYHALSILSAIPFFFIYYYYGYIDLNILIRLFLYICLFPICPTLFFINNAIENGSNNIKLYYLNGIIFFISLLSVGYLLINLGTDFISIDYKTNYSTILMIELIVIIITLILSIIIYYFMYFQLTRKYPISKIRSSFKVETQDSYSTKLNHLNNLKAQKSTVLNNIPDSSVTKEDQNSSISQNKSINVDLIIKILLTLLSALGLFIIYNKNSIGDYYIDLFFIAFPFISAYFHNKPSIYDTKSKLEIPQLRNIRFFKFPFVNGYVNGVVWLSIICIIYLLVFYITYGYISIKPGNIYTYKSYVFILISFMLNIFSWCFLGRFVAEKIIKNDPNKYSKDKEISITIFSLIIGASLVSLLIPLNPNLLNKINYLCPTLPIIMSEIPGFDDSLAFIYNIIFFIITLLLQIKILYKQAENYFTYNNDI